MLADNLYVILRGRLQKVSRAEQGVPRGHEAWASSENCSSKHIATLFCTAASLSEFAKGLKQKYKACTTSYTAEMYSDPCS